MGYGKVRRGERIVDDLGPEPSKTEIDAALRVWRRRVVALGAAGSDGVAVRKSGTHVVIVAGPHK